MFICTTGDAVTPVTARHNRSRSDIVGSFAQKNVNDNAGKLKISKQIIVINLECLYRTMLMLCFAIWKKNVLFQAHLI